MSMTQRVINRMRKLADLLDSQAAISDRPGQLEDLESYAQQLRDLADELGDD